MRILFALCAVFVLQASSIVADDLYEVTVESQEQATRLESTGISPVFRFDSGFLVLASPDETQLLKDSGLHVRLVETSISSSELALDIRKDDSNKRRFNVVFDRSEYRILRIDPTLTLEAKSSSGLVSLSEWDVPFDFQQTGAFNWNALRSGVDLDSLIDLVSTDSLESYLSRLEAFYRRVSGTDSNYASADWIVSRFQEFGYDSVYLDTFTHEIYDDTVLCENVVAVKVGSRYPHRQILVGGHRDAVPGSPGADDNGTGTVTTMEIARVLHGIETDLTYTFIMFDAEEQGLFGSTHYASSAYARDDTVICMVNSDMVGNWENTNQGKSAYTIDSTYAKLWVHLADSLLGMTGYMTTGGGSDHISFAQYGYSTVFVSEYDFSDHYHSSSDSTSYVSYDYLSLMTKATLATSYAIMLDALVPGVEFSYPIGLPEYAILGDSTAVEVTIAPLGDGGIVPGSQTLHYSINGNPEVSLPMTEIGFNQYRRYLPPVLCGDTLSYYISADEISTGTYYDVEPDDPHVPIVASQAVTLFEDDFESDQGWVVSGTATQGAWERGTPCLSQGVASPLTDYDGSGQCYVTGNEPFEDVGFGYTMLTSPVFDMSLGDARIRYARWFYNRTGVIIQDSMLIYISSDGGLDWSLVEMVGPIEDGLGGWIEHEFWAGDYVEPSGHVRLRFVAADMPASTIVEAALDAVIVTWYECEYEEPPLCGDADGSGYLDIDDVVFLINYIFAGGPSPEPLNLADADCSSGVDIDDAVYLISFIFSSGPSPCTECI